MAFIRLAGLVFGVIIISLALKYSIACAQEAGSGITRKNRWLAAIEYENHASSQNKMQQDFLNDVSEAEVVANTTGRKVLKGRKIEVINRISKQLDKKSKLLSGKHVSDKTSRVASKDSSTETKVSTESVDHHLHQDKSTSSSSSSYSEAAAYEIILQNHGDYTHKNSPHKKPPVNNDKPKN